MNANPELVEQREGNYLAVLGLHSEVNAIPELVEPSSPRATLAGVRQPGTGRTYLLEPTHPTRG